MLRLRAPLGEVCNCGELPGPHVHAVDPVDLAVKGTVLSAALRIVRAAVVQDPDEQAAAESWQKVGEEAGAGLEWERLWRCVTGAETVLQAVERRPTRLRKMFETLAGDGGYAWCLEVVDPLLQEFRSQVTVQGRKFLKAGGGQYTFIPLFDLLVKVARTRFGGSDLERLDELLTQLVPLARGGAGPVSLEHGAGKSAELPEGMVNADRAEPPASEEQAVGIADAQDMDSVPTQECVATDEPDGTN